MAELIGHREARNLLGSQLERGRHSHAYLIVGPAHVGRARFAQWLATALVCESNLGGGCGACPPCRHVAAGTHPDVHTVEAAEGKRDVAIEQVRELQDTLSRSSFGPRHRVGIIVDAERLSGPAAHAMLKTLEEPAAGAVLILVVEDLSSLPATIMSRCQVVRLYPVPLVELGAALVERGATAAQAAELAVASSGRPGLALDWLANPGHLAEAQEVGGQLAELAERPTRALAAVAELAERQEDQADWAATLAQWQLVLHEVALLKVGLAAPATSAPASALRRLAELPWAALAELWTGVANLRQNLARNVNLSTTIESFAIGLNQHA